MQHKQSKSKSFFLLFTPSWLGSTIYTFLALFAIIVNQFQNIRSFLEVPHNVQLMQIITSWADKLLTSLIGKSQTETLVVGLFWAVVGLVVYMFLRGVAQFIMNLDENITARSYVWPKGVNRYGPIKRLAEQAILRVGALIGLVLVIFVPVAAVMRGPVFTDFLGETIAVQYVVWFVASYLAWHLVIIMLRLITLRPRLAG